MPARPRLLHATQILASIALAHIFMVFSLPVGAQATPIPMRAFATAPAPTGFAVESYYRVRWGYEKEFTELFRKHHLPFLQRQLERGILLEIRLDTPHEHLPEDYRWDLRVTVIYRDAAAAYLAEKISENDYQSIVKTDQAEKVFNQEERRRFELLEAHWDVNVNRGESFIPK